MAIPVVFRRVLLLALFVALLAVPFFPQVVYPVFVMKVMCFALFACAYNLLLGHTGIVSFGHAAFFGSAAYITGYCVRELGLPPEIGIPAGALASAALGAVIGALAIRRQGIYLAMITLALAQMVYFIFLQAEFTGAEDGMQPIPRGTLFGVVDLRSDFNLYFLVFACVAGGLWLINRIVHSPFGEVLRAIREHEPRARSLGYRVEHYKIVAFALSAGLSGLAGSLKCIVFQLAALTDVHWHLSGEVILMTLLGGMNSVFGPAVGAVLVTSLHHYFDALGAWAHDGTPFNAEAVKTNLEWIKTSGTQWAATLDTVSEIIVKGDTQVTLKLSRPTPTMPSRLATRGLYMVSPKFLETKDWTKAVGTGPWTYDAAASQIGTKEVFRLFDKYWALDKVGVESIVMHVIQDPNVALNALRTGLVDVTEMTSSLLAAAKGAGFEVQTTPTLTQHFLFLDRKDMFADVNVRKAFCTAVDLDAISIASFEGTMKPVPQRFPAGQSGHNPEVKGYKYDPEAAKKYLAAAGNPKISLTLPMYPGIQTTMTLVAQMLRQVGIDANTQMMTTGQYFTYYQSDRYPLQINTSATESIGPLDYYQFRFSPTGVGNPFKVTVPELDAIAQRALDEPDPAKQETIWQEMTKYIHDNALDCNFYLQPTHWVYDPKKLGAVPTTVMRPSALRYDEVVVK